MMQLHGRLFGASLALSVVFAGTSTALAGAPDPEIDWHTVDCGGGSSSGEGLTLDGTVGQPDASGVMQGGTLEMTGGFWYRQTTECFETVGGAAYADCENPFHSGEEGVEVTLSGANGVFTTTSAGASGIWYVNKVPCGDYTVTPHKAFRAYCHVEPGGDCPPEPCASSTDITVDAGHRGENLSIQFTGSDVCIPNDMNYDELCTIVFDVDLFTQCVYGGDCVGPKGEDLLCPADCNCDGLATIVYDAECFHHSVYIKGECGSCETEPAAKSRRQRSRRDAFTIGGAVYDDADNPLLSGVQGVTIQLLGDGRAVVATTATSGPLGIWKIDNLPVGSYSVVVPRGEGVGGRSDVIPVTVSQENEAANLSIRRLRPAAPTPRRQNDSGQ